MAGHMIVVVFISNMLSLYYMKNNPIFFFCICLWIAFAMMNGVLRGLPSLMLRRNLI